MVKRKEAPQTQVQRYPHRSPAQSQQTFLMSCLLAIVTYLVVSKVSNANTLSPQTAFHNQSWVPRLAQSSLPLPLTQEGNQIVLNGRTLSAAWSQRQQNIGIADNGLNQLFGISLLDTSSAANQSVQWFSQPPANPLVLSTWLTRQYRYLNVTSLAQNLGWQLQINGNILQISTPASKIVGIRQGAQTWGDRIVIDLEKPAPWQLTEQNGQFTIALDAQIDPTLAQSFVPTSGNRLTSLTVENSGKQTLIRLGVSSGRLQVWTLPDPNRLVIDIQADSMADRDIAWAPGVRWRQQTIQIGNARFPVITLTVDPRQSGVALKPIWATPSSSVGTAPLVTTAQRWQAAAAINAGFFNRNNQLPLGAVRQDSRWVSGPILNRGAIAWNDAGEITTGRLSIQETLTTSTGQQIPVNLLNTGYVRAGLARYTPDWGANYTNIVDNETLITVQNNQVVRQQPSGPQGQTTVPIPANGYLLVARSFNTILSSLPVGATVQYATQVTPAEFGRYPHIVGGGPLLIQNRQIVLNPQLEQFTDAFIRQLAVRSAIAKTAEGHLMLTTIQNRIGGAGPSLTETAQIMQQLGAVDALNLDGGSSTTLYLGGQLLNRSPRTAARVHNGIGVFIQPRF